GIPYIPGSAVKGVTRHWSVRKFAYQAYQKANQKNQTFEQILKNLSKALENGENNVDLEINGIKFSDLIEIFGTQKQAGKVIFMDAYPVENINLKMDIMNVHYPDYYSGDEPPADWQMPVPIKFLTVEKTKFEFVILSKYENLVNKATMLLRKALSEHGVGAKTSLGYGLFDIQA
ncbi:MAG: type III-B CRISPR module RAMP protein Cmr6, partial [Candidatus Calescibacterium sp.]|nr:type III-B CRISPR module RAMP protein Cmr6 [Candidatus Calescibacterium sp.]